jgi:hypothetical protein
VLLEVLAYTKGMRWAWLRFNRNGIRNVLLKRLLMLKLRLKLGLKSRSYRPMQTL